MNKTILITAISAAMLAPTLSVAAPTIYGDFRASLGSQTMPATTTPAMEEGDSIGLSNNASRIGIKGSVKENDLTAYYHLQMGTNNDGNKKGGKGGASAALTDRFYFAGVKGSFGNVKVGRLSHAYKMSAVKGGFDPFYDTSAGAGNGGSSFGLSKDTNGFTNNSVFYYKKAGAINFNLGAMFDDAQNDAKHGYNVGAKFATKAFSVGAQYLKAPVSEDTSIRIHGTFNAGSMVKFSASAEQVERGNVDGTLMFIGAKAGAVIAQVGINSGDLTGAREAEGTGFSLGYVFKPTKSTSITPMASMVDYKADAMTDRTFIGVQLVQKF